MLYIFSPDNVGFSFRYVMYLDLLLSAFCLICDCIFFSETSVISFVFLNCLFKSI